MPEPIVEPILEEPDPTRPEAVTEGMPSRCQVCGTPRRDGDPMLCQTCGEPVLRWGWAP